jgi:hypothetical protein
VRKWVSRGSGGTDPDAWLDRETEGEREGSSSCDGRIGEAADLAGGWTKKDWPVDVADVGRDGLLDTASIAWCCDRGESETDGDRRGRDEA